MEITESKQGKYINQIKDFPPRLQKIARYMFNSNKLMSVDEAIEALDLNRKSIYNGISECKKKGYDFYDFLNDGFRTMLSRSKFQVGQALVREAVSRSHQDRKLYFQLTGDLKETTNVNVHTLSIGINVSGLRPKDMEREKGIIDIDPTIPNDE